MSLDFKSLMGAGTAGESAGAGGILGGNAAQAAMGIDTSCLPSLTLQQRAIAFCTCFGIGMLISLVSSFSLFRACARGCDVVRACRNPRGARYRRFRRPRRARAAPANLTTFGVLYTFGNIIALFRCAALAKKGRR